MYWPGGDQEKAFLIKVIFKGGKQNYLVMVDDTLLSASNGSKQAAQYAERTQPNVRKFPCTWLSGIREKNILFPSGRPGVGRVGN